MTEYQMLFPEPSLYCGYLDEKHFFEWLESITVVNRVVGGQAPNALLVTLNESKLDDESLQDVIALLTRYNLDMSWLRNQLTNDNAEWFKDPEKYWYEAVFDTAETKLYGKVEPADPPHTIDDGCISPAKLLVQRASIVLTFCASTVDPTFITKTLDVESTDAVAIGQTDKFLWNHQPRVSNVGLWKLVISEYEKLHGLDERLEAWVTWLEDRSHKLEVLTKTGYKPYLQLGEAAISDNLGISLDPPLLGRLANLKVALCLDTTSRGPLLAKGEG